VSAPNEQARTAVQVSVGRLRPDGRRIYRLVTPQVIWWTWVALAVFSLGDLLIQGHDYLSLKFTLGLLTLTGLVYVCTLWPRVIADDDGMTVQNPFRKFFIPWGAVRGIFLADSVELQCARGAQKKDKTVYSWALSAARRGRSKARMRGWQWEQGKRNRPSDYGRLPPSAKELVKMSQTEVMARELATMLEEAKARRGAGSAGHDDEPSFGEASGNGLSANGTGPADASNAAGAGAPFADVFTSTWAWPALAAILVPGIAFAIAMLVG
jgi:PH (Pleckstrin Homology) domain-containing protein